MAFPSNTSYVKNVIIPPYNPNAVYQYQGQAPYHEGIKPSPRGIVNHTQAAFSNNYSNSQISSGSHGARLQQRPPPPNAYQWHETGPNRSNHTSSPTHPNSTSLNSVTSGRSNAAAPPLDYQSLLLSLAEDYFAAAHDQRTLTALIRGELEIQTYHKLIATGLGCLEAVLKVKLSCALRRYDRAGLNVYSNGDCNPSEKHWSD